FFAQARLGVAWLPHTLVREDLASRRLVRAGGQRFDVPLRYTLIRRRLPLPGEAERLWTFLGELARPAPRYAVVGAAS
ncbi:LysR substrate-binding domain-containing protein, partial [Escherichia coli]